MVLCPYGTARAEMKPHETTSWKSSDFAVDQRNSPPATTWGVKKFCSYRELVMGGGSKEMVRDHADPKEVEGNPLESGTGRPLIYYSFGHPDLQGNRASLRKPREHGRLDRVGSDFRLEEGHPFSSPHHFLRARAGCLSLQICRRNAFLHAPKPAPSARSLESASRATSLTIRSGGRFSKISLSASISRP